VSAPKRNLWTIKETAEYLRMSPSWVYKRVSAGDIPHCKLGTSVRFVPDLVEHWFAEQSNDSAGSNVIPLRKPRQ
jgi:excisionase family DNA binding protein